MIPVFRPSVTDTEIEAVSEVLRSGWWGLGPKTLEFEQNFAQYVESKHAIAVNSGTSALHLALHILDLQPGDEVIVPTLTFVSTAHAAVYAGATPVFADARPDTCGLDPEDAARKITRRTRAIIPMHYGGHPVDLDAIHALADKHNLIVIEDAAHAAGARYRGRPIGGLSPMTCFSFQAVKNLACGDGGMITTDNDAWEARLRECRWLGISKDTWKRTSEEKVYAWQYWIHELGFKAHMNDLQAALGLVQLQRLEETNARRRRIAELYDEAFASLPWIERPVREEHCLSSGHIYYVKAPRRDDLLTFLKAHDIAPGVHYYPIHMHPYYAIRRDHRCPVAERLWPRLLSLPVFPDMTDEQVQNVIDVVKAFDSCVHERLKTLRGCSTQLRRIDFTDLEHMRVWRNESPARQYFFDRRLLSTEDQEAWYDAYLKTGADEMFIIETFDSRPVGMVGLRNVDRDNDQAEVGRLVVAPEAYPGLDIARDALNTLIRHGFETLRLARLFARIREDHQDYLDLFAAAGFSEEGRLRQAVKADDRRYDVILMGMVNVDRAKRPGE